MENTTNTSLKQYLCQTDNQESGFTLVHLQQEERFSKSTLCYNSIAIILKGSVRCSCNHIPEREFEEGDMLFFPQLTEVQGCCVSDGGLLMVAVFSNHILPLCTDCPLSKHDPDAVTDDYGGVLKTNRSVQLFLDLMRNYLEREANCAYLHELKQRELLLLLRQNYSTSALSAFFDPILAKNCDFKRQVLENYKEGITAQELAGRLKVGYNTFLRRFKKEFGETVQEWMAKQKARHIIRKLSEPTVTISEIVRNYNFADASHFSHFCRKHYHCTPTELLAQLRK